MKHSISKWLAALLVLLLVPSLILQVRAADTVEAADPVEATDGIVYKDEEILPMEYPQLFADSMDSAMSTALEDELDLDQFMAYLLEHMASCETSIDISGYQITVNTATATRIREEIWYETPEAFHCYGIGFSMSGGIYKKINFSYRSFADTQQEYKSCHDAFKAGADALLADIEGNASLTDVEKALLLHDRLAVWTGYDYANYLAGNLSDTVYTAYGALGQQAAVCQGYAMAYMYLLDRVGIEADYCSSDALNHGWNIVYIDGQPYHVDVTWDDPTWDMTGRVRHTNFLRSTQGIIATGHDASDFNTAPTDTTYDSYYWQSSSTAIQLADGKIYYIDETTETINRVEGTNIEQIHSVGDRWYVSAGYYKGLAKLSSIGDKLLYSQADAVWLLDPDENTVTNVFEPDLSGGSYMSVYGFKYENGYLICDLYDTPNYNCDITSFQVKHAFALEEPVTYTVLFLNDDGTVISSATYHYGDTVVVPENPTKAADGTYTYVFAGWDKEVVACTGDATYTATYTATEIEQPDNNAITKQPEDQLVAYKETAQFTVEATGVVSYKWQYRKNAESSWKSTTLSGYKTATLSVAMTSGRNGYQYRCVLTMEDGSVLYSDAATLTMDAKVEITGAPSDTAALEGSFAPFTVEATDVLSYRWYYRRNAEDSWHTTTMKGYVTNTLQVLVTPNRDGYQYRCKITGLDGTITYTEPATLTVTPVILSQPTNIAANVKETAVFTVEAQNVASYRWLYRKTVENSWGPTSMTGNATNELSVPVIASRAGYQYKCELTNTDGSILYTNEVTLYLAPSVTLQPADQTVAAGEAAVFTVEATDVVSYQWQFSRDGSTWSNTTADGNKTATLNVTAKASNNGYQYRCKIVGAEGSFTYSDIVTLTVTE